MSLEGELRVGIVVVDGRIGKLSISSTRPDLAASLLVGRTRTELTAAVPRLYSICGQSQAAACTLACAAALGEPIPTGELERWSDAVATETLRDAAWRSLLDAPRWLAEQPSPEAVLAGRVALNYGRGGPEDALSIGAAAFGMPAEEWLAIDALAAFDAWTNAGETAAARYLRRLREEDAAMTQVHEAPQLLAAQGHASWLGDWLEAARDEPHFARQPTFRGAPAETGALARQLHDPLVAAIVRRSVSRVPARFAARLRELALLLTGRQIIHLGATALPGGEGLAWVENGRGLLVHRVSFERNGATGQARSTAYQIVAPTEWNFHPQGALTMALLGARAAEPEAVRQRATRIVNSLDPCVACQIEFDDA